MQAVSELYQALRADYRSWIEVKVVIDGVDYLVDKISSLSTSGALFPSGKPTVGGTVGKQITLKLWNHGFIARGASLKPYVRYVNEYTGQASEWIQKGVYFIDTRDSNADVTTLSIYGFDPMLKTEQQFTTLGDQGQWPRTDIAVVREIAQRIGATVDSRTIAMMTQGYSVEYPGAGDDAYSMREVLSYIGVMYAGNWTISDTGTLLLVPFKGLSAASVADVARAVSGFKISPVLDTYTKVILNCGDAEETVADNDGNTTKQVVQVSYEAGSAGGRELEVTCPWGTQAMANSILTAIRNYAFQPFSASGAVLDPAVELGDTITVCGESVMLEQQAITFPRRAGAISRRGPMGKLTMSSLIRTGASGKSAGLLNILPRR